ncbi:MAG: hypothetical protein NW200_02730 [Hyphomonadaceae bacterium]|nr:hypothetical protein [Hyphomonadaceae bacterium]
MRILLSFVALALCACTAPGAPNGIAATPAVTEAAACAARGGAIRPVCRRQIATCVIAYSDAGKACTDGAQCAGDCVREGDALRDDVAVTGQCQADSDPCGCRTTVTAGKATTICVD